MGYLLIFIGTFAEGATLLMLGGYFAHRGYLDLWRHNLHHYELRVAGGLLVVGAAVPAARWLSARRPEHWATTEGIVLHVLVHCPACRCAGLATLDFASTSGTT